MKNRCRRILVALLSLFLLLTLLWGGMPYWLPRLLAVWLPDNSHIVLKRPGLGWGSVSLPAAQYIAGDCQLVQLTNIRLHYKHGWQINADRLHGNSDCLSQLPVAAANTPSPEISQWQTRLPHGRLHIARVTLQGLEDYAGSLTLNFSPSVQRLRYNGTQLALNADLQGRRVTITHLRLTHQSLTLSGQGVITLSATGQPEQGQATAQLQLPADLAAAVSLPAPLYADLHWYFAQKHTIQGQLVINTPAMPQPLLDLPWQLTATSLKIYDGRWQWPSPAPLNGGLALTLDNWQQGPEQAQLTARLSVRTQGAAGKGNVVLTAGPGKLTLADNPLSLRLTGQANYQALQFYASLPAELRGDWQHPQLQFLPGALLWSRGQLIDGLNIDQIRWPLAGINLSQQGINGRLQAILRGRDSISGDFAVHLDGHAQNFLPEQGQWQWHYWGQGSFAPMQAHWKTRGNGEWREHTVTLTTLETDFDQLRYTGVHTGATRLSLRRPLLWVRDAQHPAFSGEFVLQTAATTFSSGAGLPPSRLNFSVHGQDPGNFTFKGGWHAGTMGPLRVNGRWDGTRLRGEVWWPAQPLDVFQPLLAPALKTTLDGGQFYAQVAFSAAPGQGLAAAGHGVVKNGSGWLAETRISGVDFILPFVLIRNVWQLGPRQPVTLRIGQINSVLPASNLTANLQGYYPWSETRPLILSNVSVGISGGDLSIQQWRLPQRDPALLRLHNLEISPLISALNTKSIALSGRINGALPFWPGNNQWLIRHGWLSNPSALTLRMDADLIDGMVKNNGAVASSINWLRYLEFKPHSWIGINLDKQGKLVMTASIQGTGEVDGKRGSVRLNYRHEDNLFALWRNLRFGDNLQNWLIQRMEYPHFCDQPEHEPQRQQCQQ